MNSARLLTVVIITTLKTEVAAKDACSLPSNGTDSCSPSSSAGTYNLASKQAQNVRDGSCDFGQGPCGYTQGCRQGKAPEWKHRTQGYFEMRAPEGGAFGHTSVLESPVLDISRPSCLTFTALLWQPVLLAVVLSTAHTNCTALDKKTHPYGGNKSFTVDLPPGVVRIMFQGFHGGDRQHYARIYNVSVNEGCCQDPAWSRFIEDEGINPDHPHCSWTITGITIHPTYGAVIETDARDGTLTTPLIRATSSNATDCLTFEYFLSNFDGNSLTVCITDTQNVFLPEWTMSNENNTGSGPLVFLQGQIPVSSSVAFKIRFTVRREVMTNNAILAIRNVRYKRGSTQAQCSGMPFRAFAPTNLSCTVSEPPTDQGHSNAGAIAGGVIVAVLIVLAIAIGGFIFWRRRNKQKTTGGAGTSFPMPVAAMMNDGRARSTNQYTPSGRANSSAPTYHGQTVAHLSQQPSRATNNGYSVAKSVAPRGIGRVNKEKDLRNPFGMADPEIHGLPNPAFVDDYNHLGAHGQSENAGPSRGGQDDDYSHVDAQTARPNVISNSSVNKSHGNPENSLQSNDDHQLERGDIYATPHKVNKDGGPASHEDYNRLGDVKGGKSVAIKGRGATPRAYDHVGITHNEADPYDVAHQPQRNQTVDSDYNRLGDV